VKFHTNIANRWLFMIQIKVTVILLYSQIYFDMFREAVFIRTRCRTATHPADLSSKTDVSNLLFVAWHK